MCGHYNGFRHVNVLSEIYMVRHSLKLITNGPVSNRYRIWVEREMIDVTDIFIRHRRTPTETRELAGLHIAHIMSLSSLPGPPLLTQLDQVQWLLGRLAVSKHDVHRHQQSPTTQNHSFKPSQHFAHRIDDLMELDTCPSAPQTPRTPT